MIRMWSFLRGWLYGAGPAGSGIACACCVGDVDASRRGDSGAQRWQAGTEQSDAAERPGVTDAGCRLEAVQAGLRARDLAERAW